MNQSLLSIENLKVGIAREAGDSVLLEELSLEIHEFEVVALVGGSGSGKTTAALSILGLLPAGIYVSEGKILFRGENLLNASQAHMRQIRGREIAMVFQEPLSAFNPVFTIGFQIEEVLKFHAFLRKTQRKKRVKDLLEMVGIADPRRISGMYPHQLSGGMRQRAMIAQAIAACPKLIIADEPTSNLDVTLQALVIELFKKLKDTLKLSILLITHDLGVVNQLADSVAILYQGRIVECGPPKEVLTNPQHPLSCELVEAVRL